MPIIPFRLLQATAWAPGISSAQEWKDYFDHKRFLKEDDSPNVSDIPPLMRRRMSRLSRMATSVAIQCCQQANVFIKDVRAVLASRHGEISALINLFEQMNNGDSLSPTVFSNSVHHTPLANFSLVAGNRQLIRAVSAREESFPWGFLDAVGLLNDNADSPVLIVVADEIVPEPLHKLVGQNSFPYAVGLMLSHIDASSGEILSFDMTPRTSLSPSVQKGPIGTGIPALDFFRWYLNGDKKFECVQSKWIMKWNR